MEKYLNNYLDLLGGLKGGAKGGAKITFITGNIKKLEELQYILGNSIDLDNKKIDLPELQGEPEEIAIEKAKEAARQINGPVLIEDVSLCFNSLGGLPGVYIKWFVDKLGNDGISKLLDSFDDKSAYAQCIYTYCEGPSSTPITFVGKVNGKIVKPRGSEGFGWDAIFQPEGYDKTYGEMVKEERLKINPRYVALMIVKNFFTENPTKLSRQTKKTSKKRKNSRK
jgi:inosine triphosphate pyrophosphatase